MATEKTRLLPSEEKTGGSQRDTHKFCCSWHPKFVELAMSLYFLAYNGMSPVIEQATRFIIKTQKQAKLDKHMASFMDSIFWDPDLSKMVPVRKCPADGNTSTPFDKLLDDSIQSTSSMWLMYIDICQTVPAIFAILIICTLGDKTGRKPGLLLPSIGSTIRSFSFFLCLYFRWSPVLVLVGSVLEGLTGSHLCFYASIYAYIADTTSAKSRSLRYIIAATINTLISAFVNLAVGYLIDAVGFTLVFLIFGAIHLTNTVYILLCIPNSKPSTLGVDDQGSNKVQRMTIWESAVLVSRPLYGAVQIFVAKGRDPTVRIKLMLLLLAFLLQACVMLGKGSVDILFVLGYPICLTSISYGIYSFVSNLYHGFLGLSGIWILTKHFRDITIEIIGGLSWFVSRFIFAFATNMIHVYISVFVSFGVNVCLPLVRSLMSQLVSAEKQGSLMAIVFSLETLCDVLAGILYNAVYAASVSWWPPFVFLLMAAMYALNIAILIIYFFVERQYPTVACDIDVLSIDAKTHMKEEVPPC